MTHHQHEPGAYGRKGGWGGFGRRRVSPLAVAGVKLTDEQVERLAQLKGDMWLRFSQAKADILPKMRECMRLLSEPTIDKAKVRALHKEIQKTKNEAGDYFVENLLAGSEVLTADQRRQVRLAMMRYMMGLDALSPEE